MTVSIQVPDDIARQLHLDGPGSSRRALQAVALDGYRAGDLSRGQVSELLGLSYWETEALIKEHGCGTGPTWAEVEEDVETLRKLPDQ